MKKNLLITGGSGYLGVNLALSLRRKYNVFLGSRNQKRNHYAQYTNNVKNINTKVFNEIIINSFRSY